MLQRLPPCEAAFPDCPLPGFYLVSHFVCTGPGPLQCVVPASRAGGRGRGVGEAEGPDGENLHFCACQKIRSFQEKVSGALCYSSSVPMGSGMGRRYGFCPSWTSPLWPAAPVPVLAALSYLCELSPTPRQTQGRGSDPPHVAQRGPSEPRSLAPCPGGAVSRQGMSLNKNDLETQSLLSAALGFLR